MGINILLVDGTLDIFCHVLRGMLRCQTSAFRNKVWFKKTWCHTWGTEMSVPQGFHLGWLAPKGAAETWFWKIWKTSRSERHGFDQDLSASFSIFQLEAIEPGKLAPQGATGWECFGTAFALPWFGTGTVASNQRPRLNLQSFLGLKWSK